MCAGTVTCSARGYLHMLNVCSANANSTAENVAAFKVKAAEMYVSWLVLTALQLSPLNLHTFCINKKEFPSLLTEMISALVS